MKFKIMAHIPVFKDGKLGFSYEKLAEDLTWTMAKTAKKDLGGQIVPQVVNPFASISNVREKIAHKVGRKRHAPKAQ